MTPAPVAHELDSFDDPDSINLDAFPLQGGGDCDLLLPREGANGLGSPNLGTLFDSLMPEERDVATEPLNFMRAQGALQHPSSILTEPSHDSNGTNAR